MADVTRWHRRLTLLRLGPLPLKITLGPLTIMAGLGALTAIAIHPQVFEPIFALEPLTPSLREGLQWLSLGSALYAAILLLLPPSLAQVIALPSLGLILMLDAEVALHLYTRLSAPSQTLSQLRQVTAPQHQDFMYQAHPFLQYTGNPAHPGFNNLGFPDERDFIYAKEPGVVRVACVGASTTASGYPKDLENALNQAGRGDTFEVMNFGVEGWTSAHVASNIALNVMDFSPDYVVFHQGWNDNRMLQGPCPRRDYLYAPGLEPEAPRPKRDPSLTLLLEFSIAARHFALRNQQLREDADGGAMVQAESTQSQAHCEQVDDLWAYRRNLGHIIGLTRGGGAQLILTTQPHSKDPYKRQVQYGYFIDKTNSYLRSLAAKEGLPLVDLDKEMTGVMEEEFVDLGHMSPKGRAHKGARIADEILSFSSPPQ